MARTTSMIALRRPLLLLTALIATSTAAASAQGNSPNAPPSRAVRVVDAIEVRDADNPARRPIQFRLANINVGDPAIFTVPSGTRLVVEFVSAIGRTNEVCSPVSIEVNNTAAGVTQNHSFAPSHVFPSPLTLHTHFVISQPTRLYGDPDTTVSVSTVAAGTQTGGHCEMRQNVSFSGYLVELP